MSKALKGASEATILTPPAKRSRELGHRFQKTVTRAITARPVEKSKSPSRTFPSKRSMGRLRSEIEYLLRLATT
jgi:hypothetical protein